jgi:hypothetical protein
VFSSSSPSGHQLHLTWIGLTPRPSLPFRSYNGSVVDAADDADALNEVVADELMSSIFSLRSMSR